MEQPALSRAPQAQSGPFWRDRGFWLQLVIQSAVFFLFGAMDAGNAVSFGPVIPSWVLVGGYTLVFAGLLIQRWRAETGLTVVAVGLFAAAGSLSGIYILAYLVVCYEAWFISAYVRRRRGLWLALLTAGAVATVVTVSIMSGSGWAWGASTTAVDPAGEPYTPPDAQLVVMGAILGLLAVISIGLFWQLGMTTRRQYERMESLAARVELAAVAERTRIAREMHDIVAHSLTAVIAQADGGRYAGRQDPSKAIEALDTISRTGRDALAQMRQLLSVLRSDRNGGGASDASRDTSAPPGVAGVAGLVEDARRSGLSVDYEVLGTEGPVDVAAGLTVYRTVQECLTNVLKHAGPTRARVVLDWNVPGKLRVTVDNAPGNGFIDSDDSDDGRAQGLVGLRERARIHGGTAEWGASEMYVGGWRVDVVLSI
ncbi:histidine kinase [Corynebacterium glyciniphilum]|uniref:histidine kinase n=1 Tax=Corynebacterium glyciniphilum TaxID=1404244 RepID=UPI0026513618|nr:histidine kinase [Corynebacterium glyciniphilum]MDN5684062.1 histidine kinase [Corynebacterium glyciniphilum]